MSFSECCVLKLTAGGRRCPPFLLFTSLFANCAVRSRDTSVRGQHGGHACGVPKQIASIVQLTPPRETSIPSTEPVRRCSNSQQNGRGQQTSVPVPARNQGGPFSKCTAACVSCCVRPANLSYPPLQPHCPAAEICALLESLCASGNDKLTWVRETVLCLYLDKSVAMSLRGYLTSLVTVPTLTS